MQQYLPQMQMQESSRQLSEQEIQDLMREGYSRQEIIQTWEELKMEDRGYRQPPQQQYDARMYAQNSAFAPQVQDNLIKWQLELDNILERCEHILKGDVLTFQFGNLIWQPNPNPEKVVLAEYGVNEIMRILSTYLNRNTILSDYEDNEIREKVLDFGVELNNLFFCKYEEIFNYPTFKECLQVFKQKVEDKRMQIDTIYKEIFGVQLKSSAIDDIVKIEYGYQRIMDELGKIKRELTLSRRKNYPMLHRQMVDIVHSGYKRALKGGERRSLREARQITQTEQLAGGGGQGVTVNAMSMPQTRGILNPMRYIVGKYKQ